MIDKLREEIVESEKARTDLMKWKLILIAGIGGAALGIGSEAESIGHTSVLLALIPFVRLYVDALCIHNHYRILVIAKFLRTLDKTADAKNYEDHCLQHRPHFSLESFALVWTTVGLSIMVTLIGTSGLLQDLIGMSKQDNAALDWVKGILFYSGLIGGTVAIVFFIYHWRTGHRLDNDKGEQ